MEPFSLKEIRQQNLRRVYRLICGSHPISRSRIAAALGMSLPTVTQHLETLMESGLIRQDGFMASSIGRRAAAYVPCPSARAAVGAEILPHQLTIAAAGLDGEILGSVSCPLDFHPGDSYFESLAQAILGLLSRLSVPAEHVLGAGIGLQGLVSPDGQEVIYGRISNCTGMKADPLQKRLPFPCRFRHDAECAAALELWERPACTDAIYLSLSMHLGGAILLNGSIQEGRWGVFEHMTLEEDGPLCYCGKRGCLECYCSAEALTGGESLKGFFDALRGGDPDHAARWDRYLRRLAQAVNNLRMVMDTPVILGGHIAPYLLPEDLDRLFALIQQRSAFPEPDNFLLTGVQKPCAIALGAAIPYLREFLAQPDL